MAKPILNVHIDEQVKEKLKEAAKKENRSVANLVETILRHHLEKTPCV